MTDTAVDLPLLSLYWENRYQYNAVPLSPSVPETVLLLGQWVARRWIGFLRMENMGQLLMLELILGTAFQGSAFRHFAALQTKVSFILHIQGWALLRSVWAASRTAHIGHPLIHWLVTHNILFPLYTFTIVFYTSCIPEVLWGSFINTYTQGWDLISLIYIYCIPSKPFFAISRQHPDAKSLLNDNTELQSIFY